MRWHIYMCTFILNRDYERTPPHRAFIFTSKSVFIPLLLSLYEIVQGISRRLCRIVSMRLSRRVSRRVQEILHKIVPESLHEIAQQSLHEIVQDSLQEILQKSLHKMAQESLQEFCRGVAKRLCRRVSGRLCCQTIYYTVSLSFVHSLSHLLIYFLFSSFIHLQPNIRAHGQMAKHISLVMQLMMIVSVAYGIKNTSLSSQFQLLSQLVIIDTLMRNE